MAEQAEWTAQDAPVVTIAADPDRNCAGCRHWSNWIGECGDCLIHAHQRREQLIAGEIDRIAAKSARMTSAEQACEGWTPLTEEEKQRRARRQTTEAAR